MRHCKVVALNKDAKLIGTFDTITEAARYLGTTYSTLSNCVFRGTTYRQILFVPEKEYKINWERGLTDKYKFPSKQEKRAINRQRVIDYWKTKPSEVRKTMAANLSSAGVKWNKEVKGKKVLHVETGIVYNSISECARELGVDRDTVRHRIKKNKTIKGITFKLI